MSSRKATFKLVVQLLAAITLVAFLTGGARAGENVELYNVNGNPLSPSRLEEASSRQTCEYCHADFDKKALSVHYNRSAEDADPDYVDCLSCHLSRKEDAFDADGFIRKTTVEPEDQGCVSCHVDLEAWSKDRSHTAHSEMSCWDCHKDAGHKTTGAASCKGCHSKSGSAPVPRHQGFTNRHMRGLSCKTCHILSVPDSKQRPGYIRNDSGRIVPVSEADYVLSHNVSPAESALGSDGCDDCHSTTSAFFFGKTITYGTDDESGPVEVVNYKQMSLSKSDLQAGALREELIKPYSVWLFVLIIAASIAHYVVFGPRKAAISASDPEVERFTAFERILHFGALVSFLFLAFTGIMFLLKLEYPDSSLRSIHGWVGFVFVLCVVGMLVRWWRDGLFVSCDREWVTRLGGYLWIKGTCPAEKFNAGQKLFYWVIVIIGGLAIGITGIILVVRDDPGSWVFTIHDLAAVLLTAGIIGHAYLSVVANPGTLMGIITGRVKRTWAEHHHPNWLKRLDDSGSERDDAGA